MTKQYSPCQCHTSLLYWIDPDDPEREVTDGADGNTQPVYGSCGRDTLGTFAPGHDAKLKSLLQRWYVANEEYTFVDGALLIHADPAEVARSRGWERFLAQHHAIHTAKSAGKAEKANARAMREAERAEARAIKQAKRTQAKADRIADADERKLAKAMKAKDGQHGAPVDGPKAGFYPIRVKVGRWVYDGVVTKIDVETNQYTVEYTTSKGETKSATVSRDQIVEGL